VSFEFQTRDIHNETFSHQKANGPNGSGAMRPVRAGVPIIHRIYSYGLDPQSFMTQFFTIPLSVFLQRMC